jgi:hypothetical protein
MAGPTMRTFSAISPGNARSCRLPMSCMKRDHRSAASRLCLGREIATITAPKDWCRVAYPRRNSRLARHS